MLKQSVGDPAFTAMVIFRDESWFSTGGITKIHKETVWSDENPHANIDNTFLKNVSELP
jgi:hypothetical protein